MANAADTIVKVIGGWLVDGAIVATSGTIGCLVATYAIKPDTPPEEATKKVLQGTYYGVIGGSAISFGLGTWLRAKPDWSAMGITMMILSILAAGAAGGMLLLGEKAFIYSLPGCWLLGLPSPVQVGVMPKTLVKA
mgnify:CR=1 FL=1